MKQNISNILVVDDNPDTITFLKEHLGEGYHIFPAYDGSHIIDTLKSNDIDVILLDVMTPYIDGFEICGNIKNDENLNYIPVILVTALSDRENVIKGLNAGADDFISKPVDYEVLKARIKSLNRVKKLHDELIAKYDELYKKEQIRDIFIEIMPLLLKSHSPDKKRILIQQMLDKVEIFFTNCYQKSGQFCDDDGLDSKKINPENIEYGCCELMGHLGGSFETYKSDKNDVLFVVNGTVCPWGVQQAKLNPVLCNLTKGIIERITKKAFNNSKVQTIKTMGNGDDCCQFEIIEFKK
ncbi:response regulator receiver protein [Methanohalobium evestigatum Z-7303]|uniref:Response regulator receiver protein n=1 Tax=Methanohalobium evestigatum (strain ATCC BAA-1072 / DSM 3721 / NBRC 107634 / OCM 161 / Z-7303) TaxID=644295 RepID=D7E9Z9_METEZ|nr:methanogen output domain 1-containing protein [Methanohalobium evestigatum]ADI74421.1 response regulator receiver protein [Methanohalobium evestigatum Z-7303]